MRYIDADNLPRHGKRGGVVYWRDIEAQPPADVVEVVRCKDCIYRFGSSCKWREDETPDPDDYCSIGENL